MTDGRLAAPTRRDRLRRAAYLAGLVLGGGLLLYQIGRGAAAVAERGWRGFDFGWLAVAGGASVVGVGLQMLGWLSLSNGLGTRLTVRQAWHGYFVSFLPRYIPGLVWGYLGRSEWLYRNYGIEYALSNFGSLVEIAAVLISNTLTVALCLALVYPWPAWPWAIVAAWVFGLAAPGWLIWQLRRQSIGRPAGIRQAPPAWFQVGWAWVMGVISFQVVWLCYGVSVAAIFLALGLEGNVFSATAAFCLAWLAGFVLVFVPAGLGIRESVLSSLIMVTGGILAGPASLVAVISRLFIVLSELFWVLLGVGLRIIRKY